MENVYITIYNLLIQVYGTLPEQPPEITESFYWLAWIIVTMFVALICYFVLNGITMIVDTFGRKKEAKKVKIYHYRSRR